MGSTIPNYKKIHKKINSDQIAKKPGKNITLCYNILNLQVIKTSKKKTWHLSLEIQYLNMTNDSTMHIGQHKSKWNF